MTPETKICQNCKNQFTIEPEDFVFYDKMKVPAPIWCPECRLIRRMIWRNETSLYAGRLCVQCQKSIISIYNPKSTYVVYCHDCYNSDSWDPKEYALDYDETRPFFDQFNELLKKVPKMTTYVTSGVGPNVNSEYTNTAGGNKDCYLLFNGGLNENVMYSRGPKSCKDSLDLYLVTQVELGYELVNVHKSSRIIWSKNSPGCVDSAFLLNCSGCSSCFGCVNLRGQSYNFFNQPLSKEKYLEKVRGIMGSYAEMEKIRQEFKIFALKFPYRENNNNKVVNCVGDYLTECKNLFDCFEVTGSEDGKYLFASKQIKDSYDVVGYGYHSELLLECVSVGEAHRIIGSVYCEKSTDLEYCFALMTSDKDCFGCDGLKNSQYCILNKQYTQEEYQKIRAKIISKLKAENLYGLFFPIELCPFAYNETVAQDNFPLTKEQALQQGFKWQEDIQVTKGKETMRPDQIPDHINNVTDTILKEVLACVTCGRNFKIIKSELDFYRKMILPIPRQCFYCRHVDRISRR
ncbi:hypothetical protein HY061_01470, partial [Candidatus Azambacteria bacterium]|nr:hypothetical protein [Candidatus Azambacteria bacterium]